MWVENCPGNLGRRYSSKERGKNELPTCEVLTEQYTVFVSFSVVLLMQ